MLQDRYGNDLSTGSTQARDAYIRGVDLLLAANYGAEAAFDEAIAADPDFALAHAARARVLQIEGRGADARAAIAKAEATVGNKSSRDKSHVGAMSYLIGGNGPKAFEAICRHAEDHPRDAVVVQPCTGVFGLIGFSGQPGREAEQLAFMQRLEPHYGADWWFDSVLAFAQIEVGQTAVAVKTIERSLAAAPRSGHGAHIRAHIYYERGETEAGYRYITDWRKDYDKRAPLHCHVSWHVALWAMEQGDTKQAWDVVEADVQPGGAWGPPLNVLTDAASFLFRAELAGEPRRNDLWQTVSDYAAKFFPNPGIAFADVHSAVAHAMAGNGEALEKVIADAKGPAGDLVRALGEVFRAFAKESWKETIALLTPVMSTHERIGGSRAQRDLLEFAMVAALLRDGRTEDAKLMLATRRPQKMTAHGVQGLQ
ncbi:MAG: tetratricopeptide repeat protein [Hyphomicrobiaceae bacterium]|nr:tetratricopeptide repeat protein [Hyphomicrobiaceae bacterium]